MGEEEGELNWESKIDIHTLPCIKQIASEKLLYSTESSAQCSEMTWRGKMGAGVGGRL